MKRGLLCFRIPSFPYGDFINVPKRPARSFERESGFTLAHSLKNTVPQGEGEGVVMRSDGGCGSRSV